MGPTMCVTGLDPVPTTTSWTTVLIFTLWILEANSSVPSTPTPQAIGWPTRCANSWRKDVMKERKGVMATRDSAYRGAGRTIAVAVAARRRDDFRGVGRELRRLF